MVVTREFRFGEDADGRPGGEADVGGGEDRQDGDCDRGLVKWGVYFSNHNPRDRA